MRPLPRLLAFADERIAAMDDLGIRAAAIAAAGPAAALVARLPSGSADQLAALAQRFVALAAPPMASVLVTGRTDVAMATGATGVILRRDDLGAATVRDIWPGIILRSVHSTAEAEMAVKEGVAGVIVGTIWESSTHSGRAPAGTSLLREIVALGAPTWAIGGVTPERALEAANAGAWGVAAVTGVWDANDCYRAAMEMIEPWKA